MRLKSLLFVLPSSVLAFSCGGGSPTDPNPTPTPPTDVHPVSVVVFFDENRDGALQSFEKVRVPLVTVSIGGRTAQSETGTGRALVQGVAAGSQMVSIRSAPPFYVLARPLAVTVPASGDVLVPLTLPIGGNRPNSYMAFGDSITVGDGSRDGLGYRGVLESQLARHFGVAEVIDAGEEASKSREGAQRIRRTFGASKPAYVLIHYGTNDWNECANAIPCYTIDSLRQILQTVKASQGLAVLATIIPANPELNPSGRNDWIHGVDTLIRTLAEDEGAVLVDLEAAFLAAGGLPDLFTDHVHPNDRGYRIMAQEFFKGLTQPVASSSSFDDPEVFGFEAPWVVPDDDAPEAGALAPVSPSGERRPPMRQR